MTVKRSSLQQIIGMISLSSPNYFQVSLSNPILPLMCHFYSKLKPPTNHTFHSYSFEAQLAAVKERLEAAKLGSTRGLASSGATTASNFSFGGAGSRIAKPLRGGGAFDNVGVNGGPNIPVLSSLQSQEVGGGNGSGGKRSSWFFDRR